MGETEEAPSMSRCGCGKVPASFSHLVKQLSGGLEQSPEPGVWQVPAPPTRPASFPAGPFSSLRICGPSEVMVLHTFAHKFPLTDTLSSSFPTHPCPFIHRSLITPGCHSSFLAAFSGPPVALQYPDIYVSLVFVAQARSSSLPKTKHREHFESWILLIYL